VGLKHLLVNGLGFKVNEQQSHHCGIETCLLNSPTLLQTQQSHHCGIETSDSKGNDDDSQRQQSHLCGIETRETQTTLQSLTHAAIAPLWD